MVRRHFDHRIDPITQQCPKRLRVMGLAGEAAPHADNRNWLALALFQILDLLPCVAQRLNNLLRRRK